MLPYWFVILLKNKKIMKGMEKEISCNDKIFATLMLNGKRLADFGGSNFGSVSDIVKYVFSTTGRWIGIAILTIRNYNQGWRMELPLLSKPSQRRQSSTVPECKDGQYVLPLFS